MHFLFFPLWKLPLVMRNLTNKFQLDIRCEPLARRGKKMKPSAVGIVSAAILMVVLGVGFGIAQAGGNHSEQPVISFEDMEALQQGSSSNLYYAENRPVSTFEGDMQLTSVDREFVPEDNWSGTDWQARGPVETGAIPGAVFEESWMKDYGND
jgi:hypothetical protein